MTAERSGEEPKYVCDTCRRTFQFRRHYLKYMQAHKENLFDKRSECVAAFNSNIQGLNHLRTHKQESILKCMYSSETLSSPDTRRLHENNHIRSNRFICEVCHRKFETKSSLLRHLLLHGAEKPINSSVGSGSHKNDTETPIHQHDGKKQFSCHICGKLFGNKRSLKEHQETAFRCDQSAVFFISLIYHPTKEFLLEKDHTVFPGKSPRPSNCPRYTNLNPSEGKKMAQNLDWEMDSRFSGAFLFGRKSITNCAQKFTAAWNQHLQDPNLFTKSSFLYTFADQNLTVGSDRNDCWTFRRRPEVCL
ncbi:hypothetical protein TNCT_24691 [Trichonephila clavata]|uniref:C2H2-type domain-containing protein n=1 Tax=Trichonephila clavata TaxID=2740835 RepID=A0A8X6JKD0_TRICU|nr:hypothetical protein TNCT_24691 [Trichonephila clavata]